MSFRIPPALYHRRFLYLWLGLLVSVAGSQMQMAALLWHIRTLTDQPIALGGIGLARIIPIIIFSLVGGVIADTADRRKVILVTQSTMALTALALGLLTFSGHITLWYIYALTAVQAVAVSFDLPARQSLVPNLVPGRDLPSAFSLQSLAFQTGAVVGPMLSGLVIAYLGQPYTYIFNAISFLAVIAAIIAMGPVPQHTPTGQKTGKNLAAIAEGIQFIVKHPIILSSMLLDFFATFFSSANTLLPFFARDVLGVDAIAYGWLSAAQSIGAVLVGLVMSQLSGLRRQGPLLLVSVVVFGIATAVFGLTRSFLAAMVTLTVVGAADAISTIIRNTIRQMQTPDYIRGRMTSINQIFFQGGPQLGEIEAGTVAQVWGVPFSIVSGGLACILAVTLVIRRWPQLRIYNGDEPVLAGTPAD